MADTPKCPTCRKETTYSMDVYVKTQCQVCFEDKDKICALQCGHCFCKECCERIGLMKKNDINTINSNVITYETSMIDYSILTRLINMNKNIEIRIIVYNLGMNQYEIKEINLFPYITLKNFDFNKYPEHVSLEKYYGKNCTYAWKPIII